MKFRVTFTDIFEDCTSEEEVYDELLKYLNSVVKYKDLTAFEIEQLNGGK